MANRINELDIDNLRRTHFTQLLAYICEREEAGWYYGNKEQFETRHRELKTWVEKAIKLTRDNPRRLKRDQA